MFWAKRQADERYAIVSDETTERETDIVAPEDAAFEEILAYAKRQREERAAVESVLSEFFKLVEGNWVNSRATREVAKAQVKIEAARTNGAKGGRPKRHPSHTEQKPTGFPLGSESVTQQKAHQTPDTIHQTPIPKTKTV
jgi:uncharacterized protein YdaU (DUF1376 family)